MHVSLFFNHYFHGILSDMTETAEYLPYLHLDDVFVSGIVSTAIGVNHVLLPSYRHVSNMVLPLQNNNVVNKTGEMYKCVVCTFRPM